MDDLIIVISKSSNEEGYLYDIYDCGAEEVNDGRDSLDGGHCTTTLENAIDMACSQAKDLINREKECQCACHFIDTTGCKCECNK